MFDNLSLRLVEDFKVEVKKIHRRLRITTSKILPGQQAQLRALYYRQKKRFVNRYLSYNAIQLTECLRRLGIKTGDTLLLHSSFDQFNGFQGNLEDIINVFQSVLGPDGNLMMVSLPYSSYTYDYIRTLKVFDVRRAVSRMGLISEAFRRRKGVLRSLHPTHPVLALGPKAEWIVADHEKSLYPCGKGTPFEKLALLQGKILFFNASFFTNTFFHYLEELVRDRLSFSLYFEEPFQIQVIDSEGRACSISTFIYCPEANRRRRPRILKTQLRKRGLIKQARLGNTRMLLVETHQVIACVKEMASQGTYFYSRS